MKRNFFALQLPIILLLLFTFHASCPAQIIHEVFLPNTDHELNVYRIFGDEPGKTVMIIGGIQGDEPGSYLTADLYADIHLKKGNLIVVPRANFYSILLNQREGLTGDMNRKFGDSGNIKKSLDEEVVIVLKHLIAESDLLLNLHEGSGFYSPEWINDMENPNRFGQSIIYDAEVYPLPNNQGSINLGGLARNVVKKVNSQIKNERYLFKPNNHDTISQKTHHPEQRLSATYYALTHANIPAFGVETSKSIGSLEAKISMHKLVINTFMEQLGLELDTPALTLRKPELKYLLIKINDGPSYAMPHGSTLKIKPGDDVLVTDIIANYQRGLVADIEGLGNRNDTDIPFRIAKDTKIIVRKDSEECGWIQLDVGVPGTTPAATAAAVDPAPASAEAVAANDDPLQSSPAETAVAVDPPAVKEEELVVTVNPVQSSPAEIAAPVDPSDIKAEELIVTVNDTLQSLPAGATLFIKKDSRLILKSIRTNIPRLDSDVLINFKGFAPPKSVNDGNDRGIPIYTDQDLWPRYSVNKKGKLYPVVATYNDKTIGEFWVEIANN